MFPMFLDPAPECNSVQFHDELYSCAVPVGRGLSASSVKSVLRAGIEMVLEGRDPQQHLVSLARTALRQERAGRDERGIAAQDVYSIVYGGVSLMRFSGREDVSVQAVRADEEWLAHHLLIAWKPDAEPHNAPIHLEELLKHAQRLKFVRQLTEQAELAATAVTMRDLSGLAKTITRAREILQVEWSQGKGITQEVQNLITWLQNEPRSGLLAWKLPGAGNSASVLLLTRNLNKAKLLVENRGWVTIPVNTTRGIEADTRDGRKLVMAGSRVDLVGGADLIHDQQAFPGTQETGACCSIAIRPRSWLEVYSDHHCPR